MENPTTADAGPAPAAEAISPQRPPIQRAFDAHRALAQHMGVDHGGAHVSVTREILHDARLVNRRHHCPLHHSFMQVMADGRMSVGILTIASVERPPKGKDRDQILCALASAHHDLASLQIQVLDAKTKSLR